MRRIQVRDTVVAHLTRPRAPVPFRPPEVVRKTSLSSSRESPILERHAPSEIVRTVKSITAREMWEQHETFLEEYLWGGGFWEKSYYVGTAGDVSTATIEHYIERTEHV